jgi:hypothetical protein
VLVTLTALGSEEAKMRIIECDLHASEQSAAMLNDETGEVETGDRAESVPPAKSHTVESSESARAGGVAAAAERPSSAQ